MPGGLSSAPPHEKVAGYFGIDVEIQRRIGTFVLISSLLEHQLEMLAWTLGPAIEEGKPAWTDKLQLSVIIDEAIKLCDKIKDAEVKGRVIQTLRACADMLTVRNTVVHGRLVGGAQGLGPSLARNKSWIGEVRKRERSSLVLSPDKLDAASHVLERLFMAVSAYGALLAGSPLADFMVGRLDDIEEVCRVAGEMRQEVLRA